LAPVVFNGSMSPSDKESAIQRFKERGGVLLCTDSGSEGRNLQFANVLVNYDLPWNPMRLEQRIGRIHRIGQERDVHVFNLTLAGTIEDHILTTLYRKIDLVTAAVGDMDLILSKLPDGVSFERRLFELSLRIKDKRSFDEGMKGLADEMAEAKELAAKVHQLDARVLERFDLSSLEDAGVRIK
jgi:superfamily II DNA/RNA helicase